MALWRIVDPKFVAGVIEEDGIIVRTAPRLRWFLHKPLAEMRQFALKVGWSMLPVVDKTPNSTPE